MLDMEHTDQTPSQALLKALGGQAEMARRYGLTAAAVSYWGTKGIPDPWRRYLRLAYPGPHWDAYDAAQAKAQEAA